MVQKIRKLYPSSKKSSKKRDLEKKKHMINQEFIAPSIFLSPSPAFSGLQGFLFLSLGHWGTRTCVLLSLCRMSQWSTCRMKTTENTKNQIDTEFTTQFIDFHTAYWYVAQALKKPSFLARLLDHCGNRSRERGEKRKANPHESSAIFLCWSYWRPWPELKAPFYPNGLHFLGSMLAH